MPEAVSNADEKQPESAPKSKVERRGDVEKCPVCGSHIDAEAYHCPTCRNSFCYQCRARLLGLDKHLECTNQECDYYGKLVCSQCDHAVEEELPPAVYTEPEDGYWPALLILVLLLASIVWSWSSLEWAVLFALLTFGVVGYALHRSGINIFGRERRIEHERKTRVHHCICCDQPVKELHLIAN